MKKSSKMMKPKVRIKKPEVQMEKPEGTQSVVTSHNLRVLKELMSGKYLSGGITDEKGRQLSQALGVSTGTKAHNTLRKLEDMGIVVGYIPLLSEEGRKIIDAMELMYGLKKGNHEALVDIMGEERP